MAAMDDQRASFNEKHDKPESGSEGGAGAAAQQDGGSMRSGNAASDERSLIGEGAGAGAGAGAAAGAGAQGGKQKLTFKEKIFLWRDKTLTHLKNKGWFGIAWMWWYLLALVIFLAILLPIVFLIIVPAIITNVLNGNDLPVKTAALYAIDSQSLWLAVNTSVHAPLPVNIDSFELDCSSSDDVGNPFFTLRTDPFHVAAHDTPVMIPNQTVQVTNQANLEKWFSAFFIGDSTDLHVKAKPNVGVHLGALFSRHSLEKNLPVKSLLNLKNANIDDLVVMIPPNEQGNNIRGRLSLPNQSSLELGLGNLTFSLMSEDLNLGWITINNLILFQGDNNADFEGFLDLSQLTNNLGPLLDSQKANLDHGYLVINATGNSTFVNGQHVTYIENVLKDKKIPFQIGIITLLSDFLNGLLGGDKTSIIDVLGEVVGNRTLIEDAIGYFDQANATRNGISKMKARSLRKKMDIRSAMAVNMLRWGLLKS